MARATAGSIIVDLMLKTGMFETDADRAERRLKKLAAEIEGIQRKNNQTQQKQNNKSSGKGDSGSSLLDSLGLGGLAKGAGIGIGIGAIAKLSDEATKLRGILQASSSENIRYSQSLSDVQRIAAISQAGLEGVGVAYGRIAMATADLGLKQNEVSNIVETVSLALKVNGATAAETTSTLIQLSQAFGKGKLDGDEFRTIMEAAPPVMRKLAESLGVPFGALKDLAAQGQITAEVLTKAWNNPAYLSQLRRQADGMQTISGSITVARNSLVSFVSAVDQVIPVSKIATNVISGFAKTLQLLADTIADRPIDWKKYFNGSGLPVGMEVKLDPKTGKLIVGTIEEVKEQLEKVAEEATSKNPNVVLGKNSFISQVGEELKKQKEALSGFINDKTYKTAAEKLQADVNDLYAAFSGAVQGIPQGAPAYEDAFATFKERYLELVNGTPKKDKKKKGKTEQEKEQDEIKRFIEGLTKQSMTLGQSDIDILKYEASLFKLTGTQKASVDALIESINLQSKSNEQREKAKALVEEFIEPQARFNESYIELNELLEKGLITYDIYNKAIEASLKIYAEANPEIEKYKERQKELNAILEQTPTAKLEKTRELIKEIYEEFEGRFDDPKFQESIDVVLGRTVEKAEKGADLIETMFKRAAENAQDALADFLFDPAAKGFDGMVQDFLIALRKMAANAAAAEIFKGIFGENGLTSNSNMFDFSSSERSGQASEWFSTIGGFFKDTFGGFFASGGRPPMGKVSVVGERGPELFIPDSPGMILPNGSGLASISNSDSMAVQVHVDASGSKAQGDSPTAKRLGDVIGRAVQDELLRQKRPGGLLA